MAELTNEGEKTNCFSRISTKPTILCIFKPKIKNDFHDISSLRHTLPLGSYLGIMLIQKKKQQIRQGTSR